jgi:hypothetical protein
MTIPSFSDSQTPNLIVANRKLHIQLGEARNEADEWRNRVSVVEAQLRISERRRHAAVAALTAGDADEALRVLTEEAGT